MYRQEWIVLVDGLGGYGMNISEMIAQLEALKKKHGDLPVYMDIEKFDAYSCLQVKEISKTRLYKSGCDEKGIPPEDIGYVVMINK